MIAARVICMSIKWSCLEEDTCTWKYLVHHIIIYLSGFSSTPKNYNVKFCDSTVFFIWQSGHKLRVEVRGHLSMLPVLFLHSQSARASFKWRLKGTRQKENFNLFWLARNLESTCCLFLLFLRWLNAKANANFFSTNDIVSLEINLKPLQYMWLIFGMPGLASARMKKSKKITMMINR